MVEFTETELIARDVVSDLSPAEADYFPVALEQYRKHSGQRPRVEVADAELGMGIVIGAALSSVALWVVHQVLDYCAGLALDGVTARSRPFRLRLSAVLRRVPVLRRLVARPAAPRVPLVFELSTETIQTVRRVAYEKALVAGLMAPEAELLAEAIVGRLVLPDSGA